MKCAAPVPVLCATFSATVTRPPVTAKIVASNGTAKTLPLEANTRWPLGAYRASVAPSITHLTLACVKRLHNNLRVIPDQLIEPLPRRAFVLAGLFGRSRLARQQREHQRAAAWQQLRTARGPSQIDLDQVFRLTPITLYAPDAVSTCTKDDRVILFELAPKGKSAL